MIPAVTAVKVPIPLVTADERALVGVHTHTSRGTTWTVALPGYGWVDEITFPTREEAIAALNNHAWLRQAYAYAAAARKAERARRAAEAAEQAAAALLAHLTT